MGLWLSYFEGLYASLSSDPRVIIARLDHTIVVERLDCFCFILYIRNHISWDYRHILQIDIVLELYDFNISELKKKHFNV